MKARANGARLAPEPDRPGALMRISRPWVVWLGIIGFLLGVALCPFDPSSGKSNDLKRSEERKSTMTSTLGVSANPKPIPVLARAQGQMETATFALG